MYQRKVSEPILPHRDLFFIVYLTNENQCHSNVLLILPDSIYIQDLFAPDHPTPIPFVCLNGGTKAGTGTCRCTDLFAGRNCATPVCLNGGVVEKFPGSGRPLCECPAGYGGDHCEIRELPTFRNGSHSRLRICSVSCSSSSPNMFGSNKRSLAVVIQSSFSQAEVCPCLRYI